MSGVAVAQGTDVSSLPDPGWKVVGAGDFNRDGQADIALQNQGSGRLGIWLMGGIAVAVGTDVATVPGPGWRVTGVGDLNGDGAADIVLQH